MTRFQVIHSITSPYRLHLFTVMWKELQRRGINFHVEFLARSAAHREASWQADSSSIPFPHSFSTDIGPTLKGNKWHLNPAVIAKQAVRKNDYLMIGGPWASITGGFNSLLNRSERTIAWIEGTSWHTSSFSGKKIGLKRYVLGRFDYIAVPGEEGTKFINQLMGDTASKSPKLATLPNIVDEASFIPDESIDARSDRLKIKLGVPIDSRIAIWPARHIAEGYVDKGISEFLQKLSPGIFGNWKIAIFGDGPLRERVEQTIVDRKLEECIILHPFVTPGEMPGYYQAADLFLLPSLRDPNPLSTVEALMCGLPILVSNRIGNFPEALQAGVNGWGFDPYDAHQVEDAVGRAFSSSPETLLTMGAESRKIALNVWKSETAVARFFDQVL
jgi:glycosyltransferase involved in cell wall biosynthesis